MKVKVFQPNSRGKIEFTRAELEKLLNEMYEEGRRDCERTHNYPFIYNTPYYGDSITGTITTTSGATINSINSTNSTNATDSIDKLTCNVSSESADCATTSFANPAFTLTIGGINTDRINKEKVSQHINDVISNFKSVQTNDPFTTLTKELNF